MKIVEISVVPAKAGTQWLFGAAIDDAGFPLSRERRFGEHR